ncbi:peptidoglycan DD-metalloendopeptidase family protein [Gracilibacillus sp. S3-1-1]|uniref:Peptidoglycan DD-metalloendopeptidase family protein n=1 Tax=Gracilibacillus pellucidus TaxID=3095368 RepID=A0ACC6M387_9BACI|nr:peptidoglycan DD-metalloendopeptidase family protein [Gracilibacillus sp. S3-1-1]MDX8045416.1 peptidoglycan DD-metalloendopeptidase family protein [Gracilibacillus sp. S3-1-1]
MRFSWKKAMKWLTAASVVGIGLTAQTVFAEESSLTKVYHVYVDSDYAGTVDDKEIVEDYIIDKIAEKQSDEDELTYTINEEIRYVPEQVFSPEADDQKVIDYLDDELTVAVEAEALVVGDDVVGYFANEEVAEEVIQAYQEQFVSKDELDKIDNDSDQQSESLSVGEYTIIDVSLTDKVSTKTKKVAKDDVLSVDEGVTLLEKGKLETKKHKVKDGEVLGAIANKYDLSLDELLALNEDLTEDDTIKPGDKLNVTVNEPYVEVRVVEENVKEEELDYETEIEKTDDLYKGEEEVKQEGKNGTVEKQYRLEKVNGKTVEKEVIDENVVEEPVDEVIVKGTKEVSSHGTGDFHWPAVGGYISSHMGERWGRFHKGIDIAGVSDRSILAADNGTVVSTGYDSSGYGNKIVIDHNNGYRTLYGHLDSIDVSAGQTIEKGQKIGVMGATGRSTGVHLHFEVRKDGALKNPTDYL